MSEFWIETHSETTCARRFHLFPRASISAPSIYPSIRSIAASCMDLLRNIPGAPSTDVLMQSPMLFSILSGSLKTKWSGAPDEMVLCRLCEQQERARICGEAARHTHAPAALLVL